MANVIWLPFVPRPNVRVEEAVRVSEYLKVDSSKVRIGLLAGELDGLAKEIHIVEKRKSRVAFQVRKPFGSRPIGEQHAIPGKKLNVSDRCETGGKARQNRGVRAVDRAAHSIRLPSVRAHLFTLKQVQSRRRP